MLLSGDMTYDELIKVIANHTISGVDGKPLVMRWAAYPDVRPTNYGRYLVYRAGCKKMHFETWNNTGWAYNNNDVTHWTNVEPPV